MKVTHRRHRPARWWQAGPGASGSSLRAEYVIVLYVGCLMLIPSQLIVRQLGSPGTPANIVGILALLWWSMATIVGLNPVRGLTPVRLAMSMLALAVLASYAAGTAQGWWAPADLRQVSDEDWTLIPVTPGELNGVMLRALDRGLLSFAGWAGIVMLTAEGLRSWDAVNVVIDWVARFAAVVAILAIVQYYFRTDISSFISIPGLSSDTGIREIDARSVVNRVASTTRHPIELGIVMATSFLIALHRAIFRRRVLPWFPVLVIGMALPMAVSRSSLLAFAVGGLLVFAAWPSAWRWRALLLLPVAAVAMRLAAPGLLGTLRALFVNIGNDPSIAGRTDDYGPVLALYADNWVLGRGLFTFVPRYYRIVDNQALVLLVELGVVGLIAVAVLHSASLLDARLAWRTSAVLERRMLAVVLVAGLLSLVSSYFMFDTWGFPMAAGLNFLLLGLCGALGSIARCRASGRTHRTVPSQRETREPAR